jgi:exodeoxyribonuclease VII large subunit
MLSTLPMNVKPQTVSGLTGQIKALLEAHFVTVWVVGEISKVSLASSGHAYFTLKDRSAVLPAVMWRLTAQRHRLALKDGMQVVVRGRITVYPPSGKYQLSIEEMYQQGAGAQDLLLRKLKEKLHKLGYFAPERKRRLPPFPRRIALVSSPTGAAIRDMLEIITRRWPCAELWVCGVRVQGDSAPWEIAAALDRLNQLAGIDVIIIGRGGGSSEDLAAFNAEIVANAIVASAIPVISAVGHEIDVTIADLVADRRAATPSEAAEIVAPDIVDLIATLQARRQRLDDLLLRMCHLHKQRLQSLAQRRVFQVPLDRLREQEHRLDDCEERLRRTLRNRLQHARQRLDARTAQLESLSPLNVLARGYSLTRTLPGGELIRSIAQVAVGQPVEILLADGRLLAHVESKEAGAALPGSAANKPDAE